MTLSRLRMWLHNAFLGEWTEAHSKPTGMDDLSQYARSQKSIRRRSEPGKRAWPGTGDSG